MQLYVDGSLLATLEVCNPSLGGCVLKKGALAGYDEFVGTLGGVVEGYHSVGICAVYSSTKRGVQDYFIVDDVRAFQVA